MVLGLYLKRNQHVRGHRVNTPRQKSELLSNIEMLWKDAELSADDQAKTTFQRITNLMQDAVASEIVANDQAPIIQDTNAQTAHADDATIDTLAALVEDAAENTAEMTTPPPSFDDVRSGMDNIARAKPPHQDSFNSGSPEYAFGAAFSDLVRHVVRDYISTEVEGVIKNAIKSELDAHFKGDAPKDDESDKT